MDKQTVMLGGVPTPRIGLGCMGMSEFYGIYNEQDCLRALHAAFEQGYRHFDTADMYGMGGNEKLLGRFLRELGPRRTEVVVATKVGIKRLPGAKPMIVADSTRNHIREACVQSLRRLDLETIPLLYLHRKQADIPIEETIQVFLDLIKEGKVREIGLSEVSAETLERACRVGPIAALQNEYSLWTRDVEAEHLAVCKRHGIAVVAYSPLGRGFLTGELDSRRLAETKGDFRPMLPRFQPGNFEANMALVEAVRAIALELGCRPAQVALAWLLEDPQVHVIPGSTKPENLRDNFASLNIRLSATQRQRLSEVFGNGSVQGGRYPDELMKTVNL
jgi:aryl-alcohol dehydrogenase-like predicted oxidoreductase